MTREGFSNLFKTHIITEINNRYWNFIVRLNPIIILESCALKFIIILFYHKSDVTRSKIVFYIYNILLLHASVFLLVTISYSMVTCNSRKGSEKIMLIIKLKLELSQNISFSLSEDNSENSSTENYQNNAIIDEVSFLKYITWTFKCKFPFLDIRFFFRYRKKRYLHSPHLCGIKDHLSISATLLQRELF